MKLEELIINENNIKKYINKTFNNKKFIKFKNNVLWINVHIKKLTILYKNIKILICRNCEIEELNINTLTNLKKLVCSNEAKPHFKNWDFIPIVLGIN